MESQFEYGARRGMWRLLNLFEKHGIRITVYAVGKAYEALRQSQLAAEAYATALELRPGLPEAVEGWRRTATP